MTKQVELTENLIAKFKSKFGDDVDINNFYIFECRSISTEPVTQNTIFNGAVANTRCLSDLLEKVVSTDENIGVHIMHNAMDLNIGRVFDARLETEGEVKALYAMCAILKNSGADDVINKIENNVLDEVSVSFVPEHAYCSECGWDYMGDDADADNWWDQTCPNGHTIGVDGCHLKLDGVSSFSEISIVNRGAATNPKIKSQSKRSLFSEGELKKLAASGRSPEILVATFTSKLEKKMSENNNEVAELKAKLEEAQKKLDLAEKVKELESKLSEVEEKLANKDEELKKLQEEKTSVDEELAAAKSETEKAVSFLKEQVEKVNTAAGKKNVEVPDDLEGISAMLSESQQILASLIPAGGVSRQVNYGDKKDLVNIQIETFRVKR